MAAWAVAFLAVWVLLDVFTSAASLIIDVDSTTSGSSQVFFRSKRDVFSEQDSVIVPLQPGHNELTFALPHLQSRIRWDPFDGAGALTVRGVRAQVWWSAVPIRLDTVQRGFQIVDVRMGVDGALHVVTNSDATDPSVFVPIPVTKVFWLRQLGAASVSAIVLALLFLCLRLDGLAARSVAGLRRALAEERPALKALPYLISIAAAFHFSSLAAFSISPDDEFAAFRTNPDVWISQGRWTVYLVERFVLPQPTVPYLPNAIFCVCVSIAYVFLVRAHGLGATWRTYALFPLFCAFPTWAYLAEFYANLPSASVGLVLSSAGALVFQRTFVRPALGPWEPSPFRSEWLGLALQALLLAAAMGAYQSHLFASVGFGLGIVVLTTRSKPDVRPRDVGKMLAWLLISTAAGAGLYWSIQKVALAVSGVRVTYIDQFMQLNLLLEHPSDRLKFVYDELLAVYSGSAVLYGASLGCVGVLTVVGATSIPYSGRTWRTATLLVLSAAVLLLPIAMMAVAPDLPLRSLVGVPYAVWLFGVLATTHRLHIPRIVGTLTVVVSAFQFAYLLSLYAANTALTGSHDRIFAEAVYERIASAHDDFDRRRTYSVDFFGAKSMNMARYPSATTTTLGRTIFDWDHGNSDRIVSYMALLGYDNLTTVDEDRRRRLTPEFQPMPAWPARDSVKVVDGITLVKLGIDPDPWHGRAP